MSLIFNGLITVVMIAEVCNVFCWSVTRIVGSNYNLAHGHLYAFVCVCVVLCRFCVCVCACVRVCARAHVHACKHVSITFLQDHTVRLPEGWRPWAPWALYGTQKKENMK